MICNECGEEIVLVDGRWVAPFMWRPCIYKIDHVPTFDKGVFVSGLIGVLRDL